MPRTARPSLRLSASRRRLPHCRRHGDHRGRRRSARHRGLPHEHRLQVLQPDLGSPQPRLRGPVRAHDSRVEESRSRGVEKTVRASRLLDSPWPRLGSALTLLVFLAALTYPALTTGPRLEQRFTAGPPIGTLNAFAWMETA